MKYVHYNKNTEGILGYYDDEIHEAIPTPNLELTNEQWQNAININATHIDTKTKELYRQETQLSQTEQELNEALAYEPELQEAIRRAIIIGNDESLSELRNEYKELLTYIEILKQEANNG